MRSSVVVGLCGLVLVGCGAQRAAVDRGSGASVHPLALAVAGDGIAAGTSSVLPPTDAARIRTGTLLQFELNRGQVNGPFQFVSRTGTSVLGIRPDGATLATRTRDHGVARVQLRYGPGARPGAPVGIGSTSSVSSYIGNDPSRWQRDVPAYGAVRVPNVWHGIDVVYHGASGRLEYDLRLAAGADPGRIALLFAGARALRVQPDGALVIVAPGGGQVREYAPVAWQTIAGARRAVAARYVVAGRAVRLALGRYDRSLPLTIDPAFAYSTYLGGSSSDSANVGSAVVDASGALYLSGSTSSTDILVNGTGVQGSLATAADGYIAKLNPTGSGVVWATYLGGNGSDDAQAVALGPDGSAYVTGYTQSSNFPTTGGVFQTVLSGTQDAFVAKISATTHTLSYSTYYGGTGSDVANGIAVDSSGDAVIGGFTTSTDFPTHNPLQAASGGGSSDGFIAKLNPTGTGSIFSTYNGGNGSDFNAYGGLAIAPNGNIAIVSDTGSTDFPVKNAAQPAKGGSSNDGFITVVKPDGSDRVFSTYIGGSGFDAAVGVVFDAAGNAYVTGNTSSTDFPVVSPLQAASAGGSDAFLVKYSPTGSVLFSTYLGGSGFDAGRGVAVDASGTPWVAGTTSSSNFPIVGDAPQPSYGGGGDAFAAQIAADGSHILRSTYIGGSGFEGGVRVAASATGAAYVTGTTGSSDFPTTPGALQSSLHGSSDFFAVRVVGGPAPAAAPGSLAFGSQPQGIAGSPRTVTFTNNGGPADAVMIRRIMIAGPQADDFIVTADTCSQNTLVPGASCSANVRYAPVGASGGSSATLTLVSDAQDTPRVSLGGTATSGPVGPQGVPGPPGPPAKIQVLTCKSRTTGKGKRRKTRTTCTVSYASGTIVLTTASPARTMRLVRNGVTYASGTTTSLLALRPITPGTYTLVTIKGRRSTKQQVVVRAV